MCLPKLTTNDFIVYYNLILGELNGFPTVCEAIQIDNQLHVSLQNYNNPVPLLAWFTTGRSARLTSKAMLKNFPNYLQNLNKNDEKDLIQELQKRQYYKPKGRPPYSSKMIRFLFMICYTSTQASKTSISISITIIQIEIWKYGCYKRCQNAKR